MFWSFWGLKSATLSDFKSFVTMSKLLQLLVTTFFCYEHGTLTYPLHVCCTMLGYDRTKTGFGMVS